MSLPPNSDSAFLDTPVRPTRCALPPLDHLVADTAQLHPADIGTGLLERNQRPPLMLTAHRFTGHDGGRARFLIVQGIGTYDFCPATRGPKAGP